MAKIYSKVTKQKARNLRSQGWSLGEISLKIEVPKNTLSGWVKDIRFTKEQNTRIKEKITASGAIGRPLATKLLREKMKRWEEEIRKRTRHFEKIPLNNPETGKLICGILYLCEGAKYPASRFLHFGNSNPKIIYFFINLLRKTYNICEDKLRFSISYRCD